MFILRGFIIIIMCILFNRILIYIRRYIQSISDKNNKIRLICNRIDIVNYGIDNYLKLCKYIISKVDNTTDIIIQDITGREVVDIRFCNNGKVVYSACILKDMDSMNVLEMVTYDEVLEFLNFMIKDDVSEGIIFTNSDFDDKAYEFIDNLNSNSRKYNIRVINGYEVIKFDRMRMEENIKEFRYA